jgi:hypothetical protein
VGIRGVQNRSQSEVRSTYRHHYKNQLDLTAASEITFNQTETTLLHTSPLGMNPYDYIFIGAGSAPWTLAQSLAENAVHKALLLGSSYDLIERATQECVPSTKVLKGVLSGGMDLVQHTIREGGRSLASYSYM